MRSKRKPILLIGFLSLLIGLSAPTDAARGQSEASLDRIVNQIDAMFPPVEATVLSVEDTTLTLDLRQGQPVQKGDRLQLIRFGEDLIHPVTKKKVGRKETDLGEVEILEVRKDFSLARVLEPSIEVRAGDGVRSRFQKLSFLLAPLEVQSKKKIDRDRLRLNLESKMNEHHRFEVPAFELGLWLLEKGLDVEGLLQLENLDRLRQEVRADYILMPKVATVKNKTVLSYRLYSAVDGSLKKQAKVLSDQIPLAPKVTRKPPREQGIQSSFAPRESLLKFAGKHELPFEVVDFDIGDINGDGKKEIVLIDRHRVMVFDLIGHQLKRIAQLKSKTGANWFLGVDVGDINGNGRDEIFVTNNVDQGLKSFALESVPGRKGLKPVWKDANLYFRIIHPFGSKPLLMSQAPGFRDPFHGPLRKIIYQNGRYREGPELKVPSKYGLEIILYGLTQTDLNSNGIEETILLDSDYHLRVYSPSGRLVVKSNDYYGHDPRQIEVGVKEEVAGIVRQGEPVHFRGRLEFVEHGESKYLLIPRNHRLGGGLLAKTIVVQNSSLVFLSSTREGFEKVFETKKQRGYLSSYQVWDSPGTKAKKVLVATVEEGGFTGKTRSTIFTYDWQE